MGCCVSSHEESRAPPPFLEETVKEVLSETPKSKPLLNVEEEEYHQKKNGAVSKPKPPTTMLGNIEEEPTLFGKIEPEPEPSSIKILEETVKKMEDQAQEEAPSEEMSQVSGVLCSFSESVSTSTVTDQRDDGEVRQGVHRSPSKFRDHLSPSGKVPVRREMSVANSTVKTTRPNPSPGRTRPGFGSSRDLGRFSVRRDGSSRQDIGDVSGRRSRSPSMTRTNVGVSRSGSGVMGRIPSPRKTGRSPSQIPPAAHNRSTKTEEISSSSSIREKSELQASATANELLENPLVSLECFIFL